MPWPHDPGPHWGEVGIHGLHRQRRWDAVGSVRAPGEPGAEATLVALADGRVLLEEGAAPDPEALAGAVRLARPFRARAVRRDDGAWGVAARSIEVVELRDPAEGERAELVWDGVELTATVDGEELPGGLPELEAAAARRFPTWVARARRLDGTLFELSVLPL